MSTSAQSVTNKNIQPKPIPPESKPKDQGKRGSKRRFRKSDNTILLKGALTNSIRILEIPVENRNVHPTNLIRNEMASAYEAAAARTANMNAILARVLDSALEDAIIDDWMASHTCHIPHRDSLDLGNSCPRLLHARDSIDVMLEREGIRRPITSDSKPCTVGGRKSFRKKFCELCKKAWKAVQLSPENAARPTNSAMVQIIG